MPFTEFCCRSGGSNLNAGTRTGSSTEPGNAADLTYASGTWVNATRVFTVASGDPVADGVAVGDFAAIDTGGANAAYIARVTARTSTTITINNTGAGTNPAGGTYTLRIGGAWAGPSGTALFPFTNIDLSQLRDASNNSTRINVKNDQTYSITSGLRAAGLNGSVLVSGYSSTYGDFGRAVIDGGTAGASYILFECGANTHLTDFIFHNNGGTGTASGVTAGTTSSLFRLAVSSVRGVGIFCVFASECEAYLCCQGNATFAGFQSNIAGALFENCISHDNVGDGFAAATFGACWRNCIAESNSRYGCRTNGTATFLNCDFYNNGNSGYFSSNFNTKHYFKNCNLLKNGAVAIDIRGGTPFVFVENCAFGSGTNANTGGDISTLTTSSEIGTVIYAADVTPWVDPDNGDFRITLAAAKNAGRGAFLQTQVGYGGTVGYPDIGAAQSQGSGTSRPANPFTQQVIG